MKILYLTIDAFRGFGGIAQYNRNTLRALSELPDVEEVVAIPRYAPLAEEVIPPKIEYIVPASAGKLDYIKAVLSALRGRKYDLVMCMHINLLQIAVPVTWLKGGRLLAFVYGIEAWRKSSNPLVNFAIRFVKHFVTIRPLTFDLFSQHHAIDKNVRCDLVRNCVDPQVYYPGEPSRDLLHKYGLEDKIVVMTAGRLDTSPAERNKGFDEIIELLPKLLEKYPNVVSLIVGDGDDRDRLETKARDLGVRDRIVFTGIVSEEEKIDLYRLSSVYFMAGRNPDFDRYPQRFVLLEALACGTPFVASKPENEALGFEAEGAIFLDPDDTEAMLSAVVRAIEMQRPIDRSSLEPYFFPGFKEQIRKVIEPISPK